MDLKRIDLKTLECFVKVAELGSFTKASIALGIDQPALSRKVGQLEVELHQRLLSRKRSGIRLTEEGQVMFDHCMVIFKQFDRMYRDVSAVRDSPVGKVVIGLTLATDRSFAPGLLSAFRRRFPNASLEFIEGRSSIFPEQVMAGRMDIAIVQNPGPSPHLEVIPLYEIGLGLVSSRSHTSLPKDASVSFKSLAKLPLILAGKRNTTIRQLVESEARRAGIKLDVVLEVEGSQTTLELVRLGYGYTILPNYAVEKTPYPHRLQTNEIVSPRLQRSLKMILSRQAPPTYLLRETSALIREILAPKAGRKTA